jgi:hypothetical protein
MHWSLEFAMFRRRKLSSGESDKWDEVTVVEIDRSLTSAVNFRDVSRLFQQA